jgi:hypothetical protein
LENEEFTMADKTDRGPQYASYAFGTRCKKAGIMPSI